MPAMLKQAAALLAVAASVTLCSCQSLSTSSRRTASPEPAQLAPAQVAAVQDQGIRPTPGRPVVTTGYYPPALPSHASLAMMPVAPQRGAAACPCCGPKKAFAFSDACEECAGSGAACSDG